jgi:hypothetical protein
MITNQTFFGEMLTVIPEFASIYAANLAASDGEVAPHPLLKEFTKFFLDAFRADRKKLVERCVRFLEQAMASDDSRVPELIRISFLENLLLADDLNGVRKVLGSRLQDQLAKLEKNQ